MVRKISTGIAALVCVFTASAFAQPSIPVTPTTSGAVHDCVKPEFPGKNMSEKQYNSFMRSVDAYKTCILKFAGEQQTLSKAAHASYSSAIKEYNEYISEINRVQGIEDKPAAAKPVSGGAGPSSGY